MRKAMKPAVLVLAGLWPTLIWAQNQAATASSTNGTKPATAAGDSEAKVPMSAAGPDYVIGAEDNLHISVWKEPDLTVTLPVRPDGKISLPLLDDVQASGMTPIQLKDSITEKLKKYVADPRVTVVVTAMNSQRFFVTGEVLHTGAVALLPNMTVLQALASAGFTQFADVKHIYILRTENGRPVKHPFNYKEVVKGRSPGENISLKPGDTVVVP
jgi:polysaccharide export outer membrane protein